MIVDLDKLHFEFTDARPEHAQGVRDLLKAIKKCKVEAIPVEWISEYAKRFDNDRGHSVHVTMDYAIESMLAEWNWEAENDYIGQTD